MKETERYLVILQVIRYFDYIFTTIFAFEVFVKVRYYIVNLDFVMSAGIGLKTLNIEKKTPILPACCNLSNFVNFKIVNFTGLFQILKSK